MKMRSLFKCIALLRPVVACAVFAVGAIACSPTADDLNIVQLDELEGCGGALGDEGWDVSCPREAVEKSNFAVLSEEAQRQALSGIAHEPAYQIQEVGRFSNELQTDQKLTSVPYSREGYAFEDEIRKYLAEDSVVHFDYRNKTISVESYDRSKLAAKSRQLVEVGTNHPPVKNTATGSMEDLQQSEKNTWSAGVDSRIRHGLNDGYPVWHAPFSSIGEMNEGGCTGTLVGRRLILTAAHCLFAQNGSYVSPTFTPRRDESAVASGGGAVRAQPFGTSYAIDAWVGGKYYQYNCHQNYGGNSWADQQKCMSEDWAVVALPSTPFPSHSVPWLGFFAHDVSSTKSYAYRLEGYPLCQSSYNSDPLRCNTHGTSGTEHTLWGQNFNCSVNSIFYPLGNDNVLMTHNCDMSRGFSGAGLYTSSLGNGHWVGGINIVEDPSCFNTPTTCGSYPNYARKLDMFIFDFLINKRAQYP